MSKLLKSIKTTMHTDNTLKHESLISICLVTESYVISQSNYILCRSELIDENFEIKRIRVNSDLLKLKEGLFIIKKPSSEEMNNKDNKINDTTKNIIQYNVPFNLMHYLSNKYISIRKNNYFGSYELFLTSIKPKLLHLLLPEFLTLN